jgi:uncharacterized protein (TIGR02246 family)
MSVTDPTTLSLEQRVARLEDIEAIRNLRARYAQYADDDYDADGMASLFVEDGVWEFTNEWGRHEGRQAIHEMTSALGRQITWALHFTICPQIEVAPDGRTGTGRWYILALETMVGTVDPEERDAVIVSGIYEDEYVKVDGEWKFKQVVCTIHQLSNLDQGWVRQRFRA